MKKTRNKPAPTAVLDPETEPRNLELSVPAPPQPPLPAPELARVATSVCVIAPGINRRDLAITPEFQADIAQRGVIQPLLVRALGTDVVPTYEIWAGARRWTAAAKALQEEVPVAIYPADTPTGAMAELRLIENLQREDLSALDEAAQYREALEGPMYGVGRAAVIALGVRVGKSASHIYSRLRLLKLPKPLLKAWSDGTVPQSIVELITTLPDVKDQLEALAEIATGDSTWDPVARKTTTQCMSVRQARIFIAREYQSDLRKAIWELDDADLYPEAGPCTTCPFRGGHPDGAAGVEDPNACTRRSCYQKKRDLSLKQQIDAAEAPGKTVLPLKDSEKLWQYGHLNPGYVEAASKCYRDKRTRTYEELLKVGQASSLSPGKKASSLAVHAVNPNTGKLVKLFKSAGLAEALVAAGHTWAKTTNGSRSKPKPETAEAKAKREAEEALAKQVEHRMLEAIMKVVENPKINDRLQANLWAFVFSCQLDELGEPSDTFFKRRGIAKTSLHSIRELSPKSNLVIGNVRGECIEHLLMDYTDYREDLVSKLAALCAVDVKAIEKQARKTVSEKVSKPVSEKTPWKVTPKVKAMLQAKLKLKKSK